MLTTIDKMTTCLIIKECSLLLVCVCTIQKIEFQVAVDEIQHHKFQNVVEQFKIQYCLNDDPELKPDNGSNCLSVRF